MIEKQNLFSDFSALSKEEWANKVLKELKGRPLEDLEWQLGEKVRLAPLYNREEIKTGFPALVLQRDRNDWEIGEDFVVENPKMVNEEVLKALTNGVNAPCFIWRKESDFDLKILLDKIEAKYISTHLKTQQNHLQLLEAFYKLQNERGEPCETLKGSINGSVLTKSQEGIELLRFAIKHLPQFQVLAIDGQDVFNGPEKVVEEIATVLSRASETFYQVGQAGIKADQIAPRIQFTLSIGTSYFVELAKIRALQLLWPLLLKGYQVSEKIKPKISARLDPDSQIADTELNMIRASTQAMSAVLGGADRLTILPANGKQEEDSSFTRRIARNIQHILKMESYLDRVNDPAAGSYYIDTLTNQLAEQAWKIFQEMEGNKK